MHWSHRNKLYTCTNRNKCIIKGENAKTNKHKVLNSNRVYVEHVIGYLKVFKIIAHLHRHPRWMLPSIVSDVLV